jgi:putative transcription factor
MNCEMCGKETELYTASIEGVTMKVCPGCAGHGKILRKPAPAPKKIKKKIVSAAPAEPEVELVEGVVEDYAKKIRDARTKTGMTQKEFAKKINEKESVLHKMETGSFKPSMPLAKKLEKILHIKLIEQREEEKITMPKTGKSGALTIGDLIKR